MSNKTGIVMEIKRNIAYIMTSSGEFAKVKIEKNKPIPTIGAEYSGISAQSIFLDNSMSRYASAACFALILFLTGGTAYTYYRPISTVTLRINPEIELKSNLWSKVIYANPLNEDGTRILKEISIKNMHIDKALLKILEQAKKDNFIDENYIKDNKTITVDISGKAIELPTFQKEVQRDNLNTIIENNGTKVFNNSPKKIEANPSSKDSKKDKVNQLKNSNSNNTINNKDNSVNKANLSNNNKDNKNTEMNSKDSTNNEKNNVSKNSRNDGQNRDKIKNKNNYNEDNYYPKYEDNNHKKKNYDKEKFKNNHYDEKKNNKDTGNENKDH